MNEEAVFCIVVNDEEQYALWPAHLEIPSGWRREGTEGTRARCLERVREVWTDMRPRSLRARDSERRDAE